MTRNIAPWVFWIAAKLKELAAGWHSIGACMCACHRHAAAKHRKRKKKEERKGG